MEVCSHYNNNDRHNVSMNKDMTKKKDEKKKRPLVFWWCWKEKDENNKKARAFIRDGEKHIQSYDVCISTLNLFTVNHVAKHNKKF